MARPIATSHPRRGAVRVGRATLTAVVPLDARSPGVDGGERRNRQRRARGAVGGDQPDAQVG